MHKPIVGDLSDLFLNKPAVVCYIGLHNVYGFICF